MRRMMLTVAILCALSFLATAQQSASLRFEVASIKLWQPPTTRATSAVVVAAPTMVGSYRRYRGWIDPRKRSTRTCRHSKAHFVSNSG